MYKTEQENFWSGEFGNEYTERNKGMNLVASNTMFFANILKSVDEKIENVIEFGSNRGLNIIALHNLLPDAKFAAIEINEKATLELEKLEFVDKIFKKSILEYESDDCYDLVLIKGVCIHINPEELDKVYDKLYKASRKYICIAEYYNPTPVEVSYRGHVDRLYKRDFCGELLEKYNDLHLVDYGFAYHRDKVFPQDDITWFLLEKEKI